MCRKYKNKVTNLLLSNSYSNPPHSSSVIRLLNYSVLRLQHQFLNSTSIIQFPTTYRFSLLFRTTNSVHTNVF